MSFAGFKKQINKANQYVSEKMGSAEGTKMEDEFISMEEKTDTITILVTNLTTKTKEYIQPNPAIRAKMYMHMNNPGTKYPQTEGLIGDIMLKAGQELGPHDSEYASALLDVGSALIEVADSRDSMDDHIHENFLMPLHELETQDLKDLAHDRKKLQGRRLDYDCKKRKGTKSSIEEVKIAQYKFDESKAICKAGMTKLLSNEVEMIHQLSQLVCGLLEYHKRSADTLERVVLQLNKRVAGANRGTSASAAKPKQPEAEPKPKPEADMESGNSAASVKGTNPLAENSDTQAEPVTKPTGKPCCKAKCDYKQQKDGELSFKEGQVIMLSGRQDEDWFEGTLDGQFGIFPSALVTILVDLSSAEDTE